MSEGLCLDANTTEYYYCYFLRAIYVISDVQAAAVLLRVMSSHWLYI
jgi:hypothetical protein